MDFYASFIGIKVSLEKVFFPHFFKSSTLAVTNALHTANLDQTVTFFFFFLLFFGPLPQHMEVPRLGVE